uniref:GCR018 n=1 Tax=Schmidtea mediterranea TaxID=79327 RepID=A0A193KUE7_SCHMD|nr:GCR018 [Schmidtea mediterranea]
MNNETNPDPFMALPFYQILIYSLIATILSLATACGNLLVLISFCIEGQLRTISNYYLLSLAVSDFLIGIISMPLYSTFLIMQFWPFNSTTCDLWLSLDYTVSNASSANLVLISYDRYKTLTCPLTYRCKRSPRKTIIIILLTWIICALLWTPLIYIWPIIDGKRTVPQGKCYVQFMESSTLLTLLTCAIGYLIPLFIIIVFAIQIYRVTRHRNKNLQTLGYATPVYGGAALKYNHRDNYKNMDSSTDTEISNRNPKEKCIKKVHKFQPNSLILTPQNLNYSSVTSSNSTIPNCQGNLMSHGLRQSVRKKPSSSKAAKTLAAIIIAFFVTWFPYNLFTLINLYSRSKSNPTIGTLLYGFGYYLCYLNSTINPIWYAYCNIMFRRTFWRILICGRYKSNTSRFSSMPSNASSS